MGEEQKILDIISMSKREYAEYVTLKNSHNRLIKRLASQEPTTLYYGEEIAIIIDEEINFKGE